MMITLLRLTLLLLFFSFLSIKCYAQADCNNAAPFCANQGAVTFPANTNTSATAGPDYGCLFSQPNPAWYYFQVSASGSIIIDIAGTGGGDVDFVCWGPFTSQSSACGGLTSNCSPNCVSNGSNPGFYPSGNMVDCSFSSSPTETCTITNAISGQYYMLLLTNFSGLAQNISFSQTTGTGSTNCGLLSSGVNSQTICPNKTATLNANTNITSPTYVWSPGGATTATINVSPASTTIYTVTISGINPATNAAATVVNTGTVTVLAPPTITLSSNAMVCPGSSINLSASSGFTNYAWSGPPVYTQTTSISSVSISNVTNNMAGTYSVLATSVQGCTATATTSVGVVLTSSVSTTPTFTVCQGGDVYLTANAIGASTYNWTGPSAYTSAVQNPTITSILLNQAGTYSVVASFISGAATCTQIATSIITIIPSSPAALSPIPIVCNNGNIPLSAPNGGNSYSWSGPNTFTSAIQNPTVTNASPIDQGIYTVVITTNGCVNTGTVLINVYNPLNFVTTPSNIAICNGLTGVLSSSGIGGSGNLNYTWNPPTDLSTPNAATTSVTGNTTTTYTLTLSDANCPVTLSPSVVVTVTVNPKPVITFSTNNTRGCEPFCTDLISSSIPASANCIWKFTGNLGLNACNTPSFCFSNHSTYSASLTVTDINGCIDSISQNAFIIVDPKPIANFDWTEANPTIISNEVKFYDRSTIGLPMTSWKWSFGDNYIPLGSDTSTNQNPLHLYNNVDTYLASLKVINSFGCIDSISKLVKIEDEFAIYIPNVFSPTNDDGKNDVFKVSGMGFLSDSFEMAIYDRWGALIFKTNDVTKGWDGTVKGSVIAKQDVYIYKIKLKDYKLRSKEYVGHITLL